MMAMLGARHHSLESLSEPDCPLFILAALQFSTKIDFHRIVKACDLYGAPKGLSNGNIVYIYFASNYEEEAVRASWPFAE